MIAGTLSTVAVTEDHRVVGRLCYCSLYDECWTATNRLAEPRRVAECATTDTTGVVH